MQKTKSKWKWKKKLKLEKLRNFKETKHFKKWIAKITNKA